MSRARLRKAEAILSRLKARTAASDTDTNVIIYTDEADCERLCAAWREKYGNGPVICLPCNRREPKGDYDARRKKLLAGTSYEDPEPDRIETPAPAAPDDPAAGDPVDA